MTANNTVFDSLPEGYPHRFAPTALKRAPKASRQWQILEPSTTGPFTPNNRRITINIPAFGIMDMMRGFLTFSANFTKTGGTYARCHNGIWTMINRIEVSQSGSGQLELAPQYGKVAHLLYMAMREVDVDSYIANSCWGIGSGATRSGWAAGNTYAIPLINGFFGIDPVDINKLSGQLTIDIYLDDPVNFMETDGTAPTYEVSQVQFFVEKLDFLSDTTEARAIRSRGNWKLVSWRDYLSNPAVGTKWTLNIDHRTNSVDSFVTVMNTAADMTNVAVNDRLETWIRNNVTEYQPVINGKPIPSRPIITTGMVGYITFLANMGRWNIHGVLTDTGVITKANYDSNKFITAYDLRAFPYSTTLVNPVSFAEAATNLNVAFTASPAPPAAFQQFTYVFYEQILTLNNGMFTVAY